MSMSNDAAQAAAAKLATSLGVTATDIAQVSKMLDLSHQLMPIFQVAVAFFVLTWFAVSLRIYARAVVIKSFGWDDWLMVLTLGVFSAACACLIAIESIEWAPSTKEAVAEGFLAEFAVMQKIFRVSRQTLLLDMEHD